MDGNQLFTACFAGYLKLNFLQNTPTGKADDFHSQKNRWTESCSVHLHNLFDAHVSCHTKW